MSAHAGRLLLATLAMGTAACSVLYDPSQFRTTDAGRDAAEGELDAPVPDAPAVELDAVVSDLDAPGADAFSEDTSPPDMDASSVDANGLDAFVLDASAPSDAARDAFGPDATGECPLPATAASLPICLDTTGLYYCPANAADGDLARLSEDAADVAVPAVGHRIGLLGNGLDVWSGTGLTDFEIVREDDAIAVVTSAGTTLARTTHGVSSTVLMDGGRQLYTGPPGALELGDVAISPGVLDGVAVTARDATGWAAYTCPRTDTACNHTSAALEMQPMDAIPLLAYAGTTLVTQLPVDAAHTSWLVQRLEPAPRTFDTFTGPEPERLRSVGMDLVFADGDSTATHRAYEPDDDRMRALAIGQFEPRVATVTPTTHVVGRTREVSGGLVVSVVGIDCEAAVCACRPACAAMGSDEAFVPVVGATNLVDWTLQIVDTDLRVGVFLVGDTSGTDVLVAWWRPRAAVVTTEPIAIASGRVVPTPGVGHSLRTVAQRTRAGAIDRLEVFVAAHVTVGPTDFVFLSGLRLEGCGS